MDEQLVWATRATAIELEGLINFLEANAQGASKTEATLLAGMMLVDMQKSLSVQEDLAQALAEALALIRARLSPQMRS